MVNLQKRLCSSIEAFHRTLKAHHRKLKQTDSSGAMPASRDRRLLTEQPDSDDDRSELDEDEVEAEEEQAIEVATVAAGTVCASEVDLVRRMDALAERTRQLPDARVRWLIDWVRREMCPELPALGTPASGPPAEWLPRRVVIFTEYADTKRYLEQQLRAAIGATDRGDDRIATFHGGMNDEAREEVKRAFQADPEKHPLRILVATDAAREGVNLQNHCADLFHMDLPWSISRIEQRNGRVDRKLQRASEVRCHYFVYAERETDRVLGVLAEQAALVQDDLGSMPALLEERIARRLARGIGPGRRQELVDAIRLDTADPQRHAAPEELDGARERKAALQKQVDGLRDILDRSRRVLDLNEKELAGALCESLTMLGADVLKGVMRNATEAFEFPALDRRAGADPTWADTLDTLRSSRPRGMKVSDWRRRAPIRPVVFKDPGHIDDEVVHLHLEHRVVQRLLGRFLAQGFVLDDLARACIGQSDDASARVLLLGRLSLYGDHAARLHDEIVSSAACWTDLSGRIGGLEPYAEDAQEESWDMLLGSISKVAPAAVPPEVTRNLLRAAPAAVKELLPHLQARCELAAARAASKLEERGRTEARDMVEILEWQKKRIEREVKKLEHPREQIEFVGFDTDEEGQRRDNAKHWRRRLEAIPREVEAEPRRIQQSYAIRARRIEPVGLVYLWPVTE
jgi:hypothetical protein